MLIVDTGASITISPSRPDFVGQIKPVQPTVLKGIASGLQVEGIGTATYTFSGSTGERVTINLPHTLYVPGCMVRLLCPRHVAASTGVPGDGFTSQRNHAILRCHGIDIPVTYHGATHLPILFSTTSTLVAASVSSVPPTAVDAAKSQPVPYAVQTHLNLTPSQWTKLLWHERCNHVAWPVLNDWICRCLLPIDSSIASSPNPVCLACKLGKASRKPHCKATGALTKDFTFPGAGVSADQLKAGCPGRIPTTKGLPSLKRYHYCNLWVDNYTRYVFPTFHEQMKLCSQN